MITLPQRERAFTAIMRRRYAAYIIRHYACRMLFTLMRYTPYMIAAYRHILRAAAPLLCRLIIDAIHCRRFRCSCLLLRYYCHWLFAIWRCFAFITVTIFR